ncbi:MAG: HAMP domain-containing histidine kinase [Candidatus Delongbacteria bacterium]|nr:HAMP domain-containing histidine kinase [Candidatus Delongbacteria bacterium]MBN2836883.1 HAMP domain-containing histidine kinase [Candidatus Delongbacteria bacterium]
MGNDLQKKQIDEMIRTFCHEVKNPLQTISSFSEFTIKKLKNGDLDKIIDYQENIQVQLNHTTKLLNRLSLFYRIKFRIFDIEIIDINLKTLIYNVLSAMEQSIEKKKLNIKLEIEKNLTLLSDYKHVETIINEIIENAIKYSAKLSNIYIIGKTIDDEIILTIKNMGQVLTKENLKKINDVINYSSSGFSYSSTAGIGLPMVKEAAAVLNSKIIFEALDGYNIVSIHFKKK